MVDVLSIGELAQEAGVHIETIRYYERRGLLRDPPRTSSGYRQYAATDLGRLQFIARAKQLGFTLAEIAQLVGAEDSAHEQSVVEIAQAKLHTLDQRQVELNETRARLRQLLTVCDDPGSDDCRSLRISR